jgi:hypothetical protein
MTSDILCALDNIMGLTNVQQNVVIIIRYLVTLFMLMSCSADNLDIPQIMFKVKSPPSTYRKQKIAW